MRTVLWLAAAVSLVLSLPASAQPPAPEAPAVTPQKKVAIEFTSLNLMHQKGIITDGEYESALRDLGDTIGAKAGESLSLMLSKWSVTFYGFVEADFIHDSTQSLGDVMGNAAIARPTSYGGSHDRYMVGIRNSRFGFRIRAPEWHGIRASGNLEFDALGNQPPTATEAQVWTNPAIRVRHYNLKVETPILDFLVGQYWSLFGWQALYLPNTVEIQGIPNELFHRDIQLRVSKTIKTAPVNLEIAAAVFRSPNRDSGTADGQGGIRLTINKWTGLQTLNSTGTQISPLSIAVSGTLRGFNLPEFAAEPKAQVSKLGWGVAADAFIPIIPATPTKKGNSLAINGEYVYGYAIADQFTGLSGGAVNAELKPLKPGAAPPPYPTTLDPGLVVFDGDGVPHMINWQTFNVGLQYYFPGLQGRLWVSGNYSHGTSNNARFYNTPAKARDSLDWADANIFGDVTPAVRLGCEYAWTQDHYVDGVDATNHRVQCSAFYLF